MQKKYQQLLLENNRLKEEIGRLKALAGETEMPDKLRISEEAVCSSLPTLEPELFGGSLAENLSLTKEAVNNKSAPDDKVRLFLSLFRGREDVYAKRWENKIKGTAGYSPACGNEWKPGICQKPRVKCSACRDDALLLSAETRLFVTFDVFFNRFCMCLYCSVLIISWYYVDPPRSKRLRKY